MTPSALIFCQLRRDFYRTVVVVVTSLLAVVSAVSAHPLDAANSKVLWGSYGGAGCSAKSKIEQLQGAVGFKQDVTLDFLSSEDWRNFEGSLYWLVSCHKQMQTQLLVLSVPMLTKSPVDSLEGGAEGKNDKYFSLLARTLVRWGYADAVIRLGWEFNGSWYKWAAQGKEELWKTYWRRIVRVMSSEPGMNFKFEWCYAMSDVEAYEVERAYPGDDVVDGVSFDIYNQSWAAATKFPPTEMWRRFLTAPRGLNWARNFARKKGKYLAIPEWGTGYRPDGHGYGDVPEFVAQVIGWSVENGVAYFSYWNYPAPDYRAYLFSGELEGSKAQFVRSIKELKGGSYQ